jgi:hypothetical protein
LFGFARIRPVCRKCRFAKDIQLSQISLGRPDTVWEPRGVSHSEAAPTTRFAHEFVGKDLEKRMTGGCKRASTVLALAGFGIPSALVMQTMLPKLTVSTPPTASAAITYPAIVAPGMLGELFCGRSVDRPDSDHRSSDSAIKLGLQLISIESRLQ